MLELEPIFSTEKRAFAMGETNLHGQTKRLLKTGYNTLFICQNGWAVVSLYNKNYLFRKGDILNANWDMRPIFLKVSSDFSTYYCLMSESFFYVVFNQVSGSFCDFTYSFPILTLSQEQSIQLYMWLEQIQWINALNSNPHRQTLIKNLMHNLFLIIDAELQNRASNTPLSALPRTLQILREFGILLEKYANTHHNVSFYADKLCITTYYLSTITSEVMQDSPKGLIDKQIIMEMKAILKTTNTPLKTLAEEMHFEDTSYMSRFFRRHTGLSPSEFRNSNMI
jgi:AraC family transcriptional activator of pobA